MFGPAWEELTMTPEDYFTNAVRMFLADGAGTPESAHRVIDETATEPARAKPSRDEVAGAPLPSPSPSPATSEEIARAVREALKAKNPNAPAVKREAEEDWARRHSDAFCCCWASFV